MKRLWFAAAIILLLSAAALGNVAYLEHFVGDLSGLLQEAQRLAENGDSTQAAQLTAHAQERFDSHTFYLHITLTHRDIDDIETTFGEVEEYLRLQDTDSKYISANRRLITYLELLVESEQLTLKNLL